MTLADLGDHLYVLWFTCSELKNNIWIYNILTLSVHDEGYLRNTSFTLHYIYYLSKPSSLMQKQH